jgi:heme-degrading monooxygenase HmoA
MSESSFIKTLNQEAAMTVRVLIEREVEPGQESRLLQILTQSRAKAMKAKGYISGETLRSVKNPSTFLVLSNWNSVEDWKTWEKTPERAALQQDLAPLLRQERCEIFTHF